MSTASIILLIVSIILILFIITYTVCYVIYINQKKKTNAFIKVYHDMRHYHLPDGTVSEIKDSQTVKFVSYCKVCGKAIYYPKKKANKWKLVDDLDENIKNTIKK